MKKKQLLELLAQYPDDAWVVIDVDDTIHEDLYDFTFEPVSWARFDNKTDNPMDAFDYKTMYELRLCPIEHTNG